MAVHINPRRHLLYPARSPLWLSILAGYSLLLGVITTLPQFYYVLFALHLVTIGPNSNPLGQIWYSYILHGDNRYLTVDPGVLAGAIEDAFLLGPLYIATSVGLWLRRSWVIPIGLMTGAMIFYAIVGFFLGDLFAGLPSVTNGVSYWTSNLPYLLYPLWLLPVLIFQRVLFTAKGANRQGVIASSEGMISNTVESRYVVPPLSVKVSGSRTG